MKLDIRRQSIEIDHNVRGHIERRLHFALGRFGTRIHRVAVYLADLNGPKGGVDKGCRIVARLPHSGEVIVEDRDANLTELIDRASDRLARSIQRTLERKRAAGSGRHPQSRLRTGA